MVTAFTVGTELRKPWSQFFVSKCFLESRTTTEALGTVLVTVFQSRPQAGFFLPSKLGKRIQTGLKDECPVDALRACVSIYLPYILKNVEFGENNIMNTKPCMSSHNKRIIILIYTKDCSDTEGYKNQTNFVAKTLIAGFGGEAFATESKALHVPRKRGLKRPQSTRLQTNGLYFKIIRSYTVKHQLSKPVKKTPGSAPVRELISLYH